MVSALAPAAGARTVALPPTVRLGIAANLVLAASMATAWAYSQPLFGTADEAAHFDYAYQVWTGRLPVFERGLVIRPPFGFLPPVQWTAQHPPLYYLVLARS